MATMTEYEVLQAFKRVVGFTYAYRFWLKYLDVPESARRKVRVELRCDLAELAREKRLAELEDGHADTKS